MYSWSATFWWCSAKCYNVVLCVNKIIVTGIYAHAETTTWGLLSTSQHVSFSLHPLSSGASPSLRCCWRTARFHPWHASCTGASFWVEKCRIGLCGYTFLHPFLGVCRGGYFWVEGRRKGEAWMGQNSVVLFQQQNIGLHLLDWQGGQAFCFLAGPWKATKEVTTGNEAWVLFSQAWPHPSCTHAPLQKAPGCRVSVPGPFILMAAGQGEWRRDVAILGISDGYGQPSSDNWGTCSGSILGCVYQGSIGGPISTFYIHLGICARGCLPWCTVYSIYLKQNLGSWPVCSSLYTDEPS